MWTQRYLDGLPLTEPDLGVYMSSTVSVSTTLTNLMTIASLPVGRYIFDATLHIVHVSTTGFTVTPGFSGTAANIGFTALKATAAAVAVEFKNAFSATATQVSIFMIIKGGFEVTAAGAFTVGGTRTGGTSSIVQVGSFLNIIKVGA